jgi:hypothetical protein
MSDMEDQDKPHKPHMAPQKDAPPGQEQDGRGRVIPFARRTKEDQEKTRSGDKDGDKDPDKD